MPSPLEVAHHEAGHVVMSFIVGRPVADVQLTDELGPDIGGFVDPGSSSTFYFRAYEIDREGAPLGEDDDLFDDFGRVQPVAISEHGNHSYFQSVALVCVAGPAAQALFLHPSSPSPAALAHDLMRVQAEEHPDALTDLRAAERSASNMCGGEMERLRFLEWMVERAVNLLSLPPFMAAVEAVAAELLNAQRLDGDEARAIFDRAIGGMPL